MTDFYIPAPPRSVLDFKIEVLRDPRPVVVPKRGPGCVACGDCGCDPETEYGHGQIDACECPGCWDRRKVQLRAEHDHWSQVWGDGLAPALGGRDDGPDPLAPTLPYFTRNAEAPAEARAKSVAEGLEPSPSPAGSVLPEMPPPPLNGRVQHHATPPVYHSGSAGRIPYRILQGETP